MRDSLRRRCALLAAVLLASAAPAFAEGKTVRTESWKMENRNEVFAWIPEPQTIPAALPGSPGQSGTSPPDLSPDGLPERHSFPCRSESSCFLFSFLSFPARGQDTKACLSCCGISPDPFPGMKKAAYLSEISGWPIRVFIYRAALLRLLNDRIRKYRGRTFFRSRK